MDLFSHWYEQAEQAGELMPDAMILATLGLGGEPKARTVLYKPADHSGFRFFTNYNSAKAREIEAHPQLALVFHWPNLKRQVRIEGRAERLSTAESDAYFATRPRDSQISAWASPQSMSVPDRAFLERRCAEAAARFANREVERPPHWGGYIVRPQRVEFWAGREGRLHDRWLFTLDRGVWLKARLAP